jgi:hypothetical protein
MKSWYRKELKPFKTVFLDYKSKNGQGFKVLRVSKGIDKECGKMYDIKFEDGTEINAYPEEIFKDYDFRDMKGNIIADYWIDNT